MRWSVWAIGLFRVQRVVGSGNGRVEAVRGQLMNGPGKGQKRVPQTPGFIVTLVNSGHAGTSFPGVQKAASLTGRCAAFEGAIGGKGAEPEAVLNAM